MNDVKKETQLFLVKPEAPPDGLVNAEHTRAGWYERAQRDPDGFWAEQAERLDWIKFPSKIKNTSFTGNIDCKWYEDGRLNASATCLDKHLATRGDQVAIIWRGRRPELDEIGYISATARPSLPARQRAEVVRRQKRRSGRDLSSDGDRGGGVDARLPGCGEEIGPIASPDAIQWAPGPAQDPQRQDHAPHPAQDRRQRDRRAG